MQDKRLIGTIRTILLATLFGCNMLVLWHQNLFQRSLRSSDIRRGVSATSISDATDSSSSTTTETVSTSLSPPSSSSSSSPSSSSSSIDYTNYAFALMTEPRCYAATPFVLSNALTYLPETFKVVVFTSKSNIPCMQGFIRDSTILQNAYNTGRLILRHDIPMQANIGGAARYNPNSWNNELYSNPSWWETLRIYGDMVLTLQSDTLLCSSVATDTQPWDTVNLLGGISAQVRYKIWTPPDVMALQASNKTNHYHLNGGLSIRRIPWMVSCLRNYQGPPQVEDRVFHNCTNGPDSATIQQAMAFASDSGHTLCFDWEGSRVCPWGVHKPWAAIPVNHRHDDYAELVRYCPDIQRLEDLQYDLNVTTGASEDRTPAVIRSSS